MGGGLWCYYIYVQLATAICEISRGDITRAYDVQ